MNLVSVSPFSLSDSTSPCLDFHYLYSRSSGYYLTGMRECTGWSGNPLLASDFHLSYSIYCNLECQMAEQKRADTLVVQLEKKTFITHAGNEGPDQTVHLRSLIRVFIYPLTDSMNIVEHIDEQRRPRLDCSCTGWSDITFRLWHRTHFLTWRSI